MATLLLVRHGRTDAAGKRLTGWAPGVHLNEDGRRQAERLVERLDGIRVDAIYSSPLERCRETAAPLAKARRLSVHVRRSLIETGYGDPTGGKRATLLQFNPRARHAVGISIDTPSTTYVVTDMNGPIYVLNKKTKALDTYLDFNGAG